MDFRAKIISIYLFTLFMLITTTIIALIDGGYHIGGSVIAWIAFGSIITSLLPFFLSMFLFKKYEKGQRENLLFKIFGLIIYSFCFPIKLWIIYSNIDMYFNGGSHWAFG